MANLEASRETVLEASPVAEYVRRLAEKEWSGPAHKLLAHLETMATDAEKRHYGWPKSPLALSNVLQRLAPVLAEVGVRVVRHREGKLGTRVVRISRSEVPE